jgi:transposase
MVEPQVVRQMRVLSERGWGVKAISREVGVARNTVRRYLRDRHADVQRRPTRRALDEDGHCRARQLFVGPAAGNAVVVRQLLAEHGLEASVRTVQRAVAEERREQRAADVASVRFETAPGAQMQIDFGEKRVPIAGQMVRIFLLVAVLSYSRRLFVKAFLNQRSDDWREGIAGAFRHFGGVTRTVLGDNAKALVLGRERVTGAIVFNPAYVAFCKDWDVEPRACGPYRARTKGKTESGVKYVKRNAVAGRAFDSFEQLQAHLAEWMHLADAREHGTTHEAPLLRFERDERQAMRALPARPVRVRDRRLRRRVSHDAFVDIDTVRYSVPHRLVRDHVEVVIADHDVQIFHGDRRVAVHRRTSEPHTRVVDPKHFDGLWRRGTESPTEPPQSDPQSLARPLADYAAAMEAS